MQHTKNAQDKTQAIHNSHQQKAPPPTSGQPAGGNQNMHTPARPAAYQSDQSSTYTPPDTASC